MSDTPTQSGLTPPDAPHTSAGSAVGQARRFPDELSELAAQNAGRWVYEIDPALDRSKPVHPQSIVGAWRIDEAGSPTGEFIANSYYRPSATKARRLPRRAALAAAVVVVALIVAGVVLLLVLSDAKRGQSMRATPGSRSPIGAIGLAQHDPSNRAAGHLPGTPAAGHLPGNPRPSGTTSRPLRNASLEVAATQAVWVCLEDARGRTLINGQILQPGEISERFASTGFRIYLGNGSVSLHVDGRVHRVAPTPDPVAYNISRRGVVMLPAGTQPACP